VVRLEVVLTLTILMILLPFNTATAETPHRQASIEKIAGYSWYYWPKPESDSCILWLGGGQTLPTYVTINPYRLESLNTMRFIDDMSRRYSMLALSEGEVTYRTDSKLVSKICAWIRDAGYKFVFVIGYSTGGNALAYELTIPGQNEASPEGAIVISSMLNWEQMFEQHKTSSGIELYMSAHSAGYVRRSILLMYGDAAWFWHQGEEYYRNLPKEGWAGKHWFLKEWRLLKGVEHEVFTRETDGSYDTKPLAIVIDFMERVRASNLKTMEGLVPEALQPVSTNKSDMKTIQTSYPANIRAYEPFQINVTILNVEEGGLGKVALYDQDMQSFVTVAERNPDNATQYSLPVVCVTNQSVRRLVATAITEQDDPVRILGVSAPMQMSVEDRPLLRVQTGAASLNFKIDGKAYNTDNDGILEVFLERGNHTIELPQTVQIFQNERLLFISALGGIGRNTIELSLEKDFSIDARYKTQYLLTVDSEYGTLQGGGWYDANSTAIVTVNTSLQKPSDAGENLVVFNGWSDEANSRNLRHQVYMNSPKMITAKWARRPLMQIVDSASVWPFAVASVVMSIATVIIYLFSLRGSKRYSRAIARLSMTHRSI
jgi:hypothetical protein